jgi:hypothetical protein
MLNRLLWILPLAYPPACYAHAWHRDRARLLLSADVYCATGQTVVSWRTTTTVSVLGCALFQSISFQASTSFEWLRFHHPIRKVWSSSLGPETCHLDWCCPKSIQANSYIIIIISSVAFTAHTGLWPRILGFLVLLDTRQDSFGRVISSSQRPLPTQVNTIYKHETQISMPREGFELAIPATERPCSTH